MAQREKEMIARLTPTHLDALLRILTHMDRHVPCLGAPCPHCKDEFGNTDCKVCKGNGRGYCREMNTSLCERCEAQELLEMLKK